MREQLIVSCVMDTDDIAAYWAVVDRIQQDPVYVRLVATEAAAASKNLH